MNRTFTGGVVLTAAGIAGYAAGILAPFPGRGFSVTAVMVGITLVAIRKIHAPEGVQ